MKKVLVTGASGIIGKCVIKYLLSEGKYEITIVDLKNHKSTQALRKYRKRVNIVYGDITDSILVDALVRDHDYIINLAGINSPILDTTKELLDMIDYKGCENIIRAINFYNKKAHLIYISSANMYALNKTNTVSVSTKLEKKDTDYYNSAKEKIEKLIIDNLNNYTIFRAPMVLGPLDECSYLYDGYLNETVEFITDEDMGYAIAKSLDNIPKLNKGIYNLAGGPSCTILYREFLSYVLKYYGISFKYIRRRVLCPYKKHGFIYKDGDKLDNILHFRNDSILSYFMRQKRKYKNRQINIFLSKPFLRKLNKRP